MENRYGAARREAEARDGFIDLINTNFHSCGFRYPLARINAFTEEYLTGSPPVYHPDPAGSHRLRQAISGFYAESGITAEPGSIVVTASASESFSHILAARCSAGDSILLPRPGYPLFEDVAARMGVRTLQYDQERGRGWAIDPEQLDSLVDDSTAAVVLISPNNPTGNIVSTGIISRIGELCRQRDLFIISDEVFSEFRTSREPLPRPAEILPDLPVFTINGLSKLFASPDVKVSWIMASGPENERADAVEALQIHNDLFLSASTLSQYFAERMFGEERDFTANMVATVGERRECMLAEVDRTPGLTAVRPEGGIHLPVAIDPDILPHGTDDEAAAVTLIRDHGVGAHPGYLYGIESPTTLVMSYLTDEHAIRDGFSRIREWLRRET